MIINVRSCISHPIMDNRMGSGSSKSRLSLKKEILSGQQQFSMKTLLQSTRQLCNVTLGQHWNGDDNPKEIIFVGFSSLTEDTDSVEKQALAAIDPELPGLLNSLQLYNLKNTEIALLTDLKKHARTKENAHSQCSLSSVVCVMRHPPAFLKYSDNSVLSMLGKYTRAIQFTLDGQLEPNHQTDTYHTEEDDTNQSVSSIEDDFVTAFEHLEEEEAVTAHGATGYDPSTAKQQREAARRTFALDVDERPIPADSSQSWIASQPAPSLPSNLLHKGPPPYVKSSVITLSSDPGKQRSFYRPCNAPLSRSSIGHKSVSPSESEDSEGSSPSPVIFLDEEGYQKSLKAKLEIPQIPILKDDIEDSDSEVSEFFDSFDQFDELDDMLVSTAASLHVGASPQSLSLNKKAAVKLASVFSLEQCTTAAAAMNPQRFDQPVLPANVKKPTARKAESPYNSLSDIPDSPRPVNASGEENGSLFSPISSSAFSPLGICGNSECFGRTEAASTEIINAPNLRGLSNTYSNYADNVSHNIIGSVFRYPQIVGFEPQDVHRSDGVKHFEGPASAENPDLKRPAVYTPAPQKCSNMLKDGIQRIATELVERSLSGAFKDLQKGVSSCTSTLYHLATRLTSSVIHTALQEIGARQAFARKRSAINNLADYLVGDSISGALRELKFVKKQIFNNAVGRFATDLAEELIFEGIMEVCQFSHPPTPTSITSWSLDDEEKIVSSYARDLSESVLQEAFIELSQVDVIFTAQAAISISLDNVKGFGGDGITQALKIVNDPAEKEKTQLREAGWCANAVPNNASDDLCLTEEEYTIEKALLRVSGVVSCVSVPSAVKTLSCNSSDSPLNSCHHSIAPEVKSEQAPKIGLAGSCSGSRQIDEVMPASYVNQPMDPASRVTRSGYVPTDNMYRCTEVTDTDVCETLRKSEDLDTNDAAAIAAQKNWSRAAMIDIVVNNAFDLVTESKAEYKVEDYASQLSKKILFEPASESQQVHENCFAAQLAEAIVKNSVDGVKIKVAKFHKAQDSGLQTGAVEICKENPEGLTDIPEGQIQEQLAVGKIVLGGLCKDVYSQSPDLLRTPPVSPTECIPGKGLTLPRHFAQELKGHLAEEFPPCTPPPSPTVGLKNSDVESAEGVGGPELADTLKSLTEHLQGQVLIPTFQTPSAEVIEPNQEPAVGLLAKSRIGLNKDGLFSEEHLHPVEGSRSPGTPPPTPQQSFHEKSLKSFSRKLKGELAKEFMPVTPPSTPHNRSIPSLTGISQDTEEKAEFVLKLMRSLSEEVLDIEDDGNFDFAVRHMELREQTSPILRREAKVLEKEELKSDIKRHALHYANQLASSIVSMATEIAAICVEDADKCDGGEMKCFKAPPSNLWKSAARSELHTWTTAAERKLPDDVGSLWNYAGKVAGEVIRDAKKILSSKKRKVRKFKKDGWQVESSESSFGEQETVGLDGLNSAADQWSRELVDSVLHSPQGNAPGLMSKHSSCESVTDEYAEYIMRMIGREGGNGEIIVDHYASKLAFRTVKVGLEQAARRIKQKYKRRLLSSQQSRGDNGAKDLFRFLTREDNQDGDLCRKGHDHRMIRKDSRDLTRFAESVTQTITYEVTQKLKTASGTHGLPKSLTDSCLYERSQLEQMAEELIKKTWTCSIQPIVQGSKRYHSTGSLNDYRCNHESINLALEHYMGKSGDEAVQLNVTEGGVRSPESRKQKECLEYAEKLTEMVLKCSITDKESRSCINQLSCQTAGFCNKGTTRAPWHSSKPLTKAECCVHRTLGACQLDVPRIHIELEQRGLFPEDLMSLTIEKTKRDLSNTSLAADSGIGHDGASFTESLAAEIMTSAMISASQSIVSGSLKDGLRSTDSTTTSQQLSLSVGDDSTGSWSNLSFEDEHPDETSSFLHLSDSNGNSSSWSSLGLEGDVYEENISFPPSDSDNSEDKEEEVQEDSEDLMQAKETLLILNVDLKPSSVNPQVKMVLQWIAASQFQVSVVYFKESFEDDLLPFSAVVKRAEARGWKICDLLRAVLRYCDTREQDPTGAHCTRIPLFDWLLENT